MINNNTIEQIEVKDLPVRIEEGNFENDKGETQTFVRLYVTVDVDGESEKIYLRTPAGLKKRLLVKRIESGEPTLLHVRQRDFEDPKTKQNIKYVLFFVPFTAGGVDTECRLSIDVKEYNKDSNMRPDVKFERALILKSLGLVMDSDSGLREEDLPF